MADETIELNIDIDKLTIGDLISFEDMRRDRKEMDLRAIADILNRVVVGGIDHYPASMLWTITTRVFEKVAEAQNPKGAGQVLSSE